MAVPSKISQFDNKTFNVADLYVVAYNGDNYNITGQQLIDGLKPYINGVEAAISLTYNSSTTISLGTWDTNKYYFFECKMLRGGAARVKIFQALILPTSASACVANETSLSYPDLDDLGITITYDTTMGAVRIIFASDSSDTNSTLITYSLKKI